MSVAEDHSLYSGLEEDEIREAFAAFVCDDETHEIAVAVADKRGWPKGEVQRGGLAAALRQLGVVTPPEIMVVDLSDAQDPSRAVDGLAELSGTARVIALGAYNDVSMFRKVLDAGAADYLVKPITAELLDEAVQRAEQGGQAGAPAPLRRGRCIAFVGARGGVGASSLAGNVGWLIAEERERRVALVDLDLQFGTLALGFDLEPGPGLREALEDPERVDEIFLDRAALPVTERLVVLAAEEPIDDTPRFGGHSMPQVLGTLRERYDVLVVDLPRSMLAGNPDVLEQITDIVVVADLSLAGLRDTNRLLRFLKGQGCKAGTRVVANRVDKALKAQLEANEFDRELDGELTQKVAFDAPTMAKAAMAGKPLGEAARKSKLMRDLQALTQELVGQPRGKKKKGLFNFGSARKGRKERKG